MNRILRSADESGCTERQESTDAGLCWVCAEGSWERSLASEPLARVDQSARGLLAALAFCLAAECLQAEQHTGVLLPDGTEFVGVGVQPDVRVAPTRQSVAEGRDVALEKAIEVLKAR